MRHLNPARRNDAFVVLEDVSKRYRGFPALDMVSFAIDEGEIFGYIGPNGAGKTTTIKIMVGLISDFQGSMLVGGYKMPGSKGDVHKMLGYLPQSVSFQEWRTVDHALTTFGRLSGLGKKEVDDRIEETLRLVGLSDMRYKKIIELSGGNVQKVGLAQAILHEPKFLVMDEPLVGLDPESRHDSKDVIRELSKKGTTVFFSSHILSDVQDMATRIGILNRGRIMTVGTLDELKAHLSPTNVIALEISHDAKRTKDIESIPGVIEVERPSQNRMLIHLEGGADMDESSHLILKRLIELGYRVRSFGPASPDLDHLYLQYVEWGRGQ